jgi:cyclophilin family peptidyl-prolyl cis-trans isomerase
MRIAPALAALLVLAGCTAPTLAPIPSNPALEPLVHVRTSMGDFTIAVYEQLVPATAQWFLELCEIGFYEGLQFTRIVKGYDIQVGDPAVRAPGYPEPGRPTNKLWDEFHPALRHDRAGVVSMATAGPDLGSSEFFITTAPLPGADDRYSVFGHIVSGMDVVRAIEALPLATEGGFGAPAQPVTILSTRVERPSAVVAQVHGLKLQAAYDSKLVAPGGNATFAFVATNTGNMRDTYSFSVAAPAGWSAQFANARLALPSGRTWVMFLHITAPSQGSVDIHVSGSSENAPDQRSTLTFKARVGQLGPLPSEGQVIKVDYVGMLADGRVFDTTLARVGTDDAFVKMDSVYRREQYEPYNFTLRDGLVQGFTDLARTLGVGETGVAFVPASKGYTDRQLDNDLLYGRDLVFEVHRIQ